MTKRRRRPERRQRWHDSGDTYTIAFQGPLSGDNQQLGINEVNGVQLAIDQANEDGEPRLQAQAAQGRRRRRPGQGARGRGQQVLQDTTVVGVVGPAFSGATQGRRQDLRRRRHAI